MQFGESLNAPVTLTELKLVNFVFIAYFLIATKI